MKQKTALLIGATTGIGAETAKRLAEAGYRVILVGRNEAAGQQLATQLAGTFIRADMALLSETRRVAEAARQQTDALALIVHTADVLAMQRQETDEGLERSSALNYFSRFLLNSLLLDRLQREASPRIVHVAAANIPLTLTDANFPPPATVSSFTGHNIGQAANDLYGLTFAQRYPGIRINILNPGIVDTDIRRRGEGGRLMRLLVPIMETLMRPMTQTPAEYARLVAAIATGQHAAANQAVLIDRKGNALKPRPDRLNPAAQQFVWQQSERLVQQTLTDSPTV